LNASYRQLVATLKQQVLEEQKSGMTPSGTKTYAEEILSRLVASERAWIPFRDAECNFKAADMLGGTAESAVYSSCLTEMTKQRVFSINSWRHN
jgi:uncharacterized protein YecT (DUF1311 family)